MNKSIQYKTNPIVSHSNEKKDTIQLRNNKNKKNVSKSITKINIDISTG